MTNLTIRNGKLYKAVRHAEGLAEYIDSTIDNGTIDVIGFDGVTVTPISFQRGVQSDEIEIRINRTKGSKIADCVFRSEHGGELVDLTKDDIGKALIIGRDYYGNVSSFIIDELDLREYLRYAYDPDPIAVYYLDETNGETLKVWDDENGLAWEVE